MRTKNVAAIGAIAALALSSAATQAWAAILNVGPGQQFQTVRAAVAASHDGDTIDVHAGTYVNDGAIINTKISIVGVGGMAHFVGNGLIGNGKAFFVTNTNVTFDHIEFSGAKVADHNGAGIRYQAGNLTITNCYFHNNQEGILAANNPSGTITIDHSEFGSNGYGDGQTHNIYIGGIKSFTITNSYIHDAIVGHEIKSRAAISTIENNRIVDGKSTASYSVDLPSGGVAVVKNNLIQQGPNSQNRTIISYGERTFQLWANSKLQIANNTVVNGRASPLFLFNHYSTVTAAITNNKFFGLTAAQLASGPNLQSGDVFLTVQPSISTSHPWAATGPVSFLNARDLLGSPGGLTFGSFENPNGSIGAGPIAAGARPSVVPKVPEPPALPLFAAGLGVLAWLARGKRATKSTVCGL
jgi:hypothetical protein